MPKSLRQKGNEPHKLMKLNEYSGDNMLALVAFYSVKKQWMADHSSESIVVCMANSFSERLGEAAISLHHGESRACIIKLSFESYKACHKGQRDRLNKRNHSTINPLSFGPFLHTESSHCIADNGSIVVFDPMWVWFCQTHLHWVVWLFGWDGDRLKMCPCIFGLFVLWTS